MFGSIPIGNNISFGVRNNMGVRENFSPEPVKEDFCSNADDIFVRDKISLINQNAKIRARELRVFDNTDDKRFAGKDKNSEPGVVEWRWLSHSEDYQNQRAEYHFHDCQSDTPKNPEYIKEKWQTEDSAAASLEAEWHKNGRLVSFENRREYDDHTEKIVINYNQEKGTYNYEELNIPRS
jgi:hypothetical protein